LKVERLEVFTRASTFQRLPAYEALKEKVKK
jgi:hypothetical protein